MSGTEEREPLDKPPAEENDDSVNTPDGLDDVTEADVEDAPDHEDDPDESDTDAT